MEGQVNHRHYGSISSPVSHSGSSHTGAPRSASSYTHAPYLCQNSGNDNWQTWPFSSVTVTKYTRSLLAVRHELLTDRAAAGVGGADAGRNRGDDLRVSQL